ncbi:MAG TPA: hypothetical protein VF173_21940 [Thermoanaerobaculia bacterium]|nr:hypothetical protein [Thermoanaerobaculia bacterium]
MTNGPRKAPGPTGARGTHGGSAPPPAFARPRIAPPLTAVQPQTKVLVVGVYLADKPNNIDSIVSALAAATKYDVHQSWAALGAGPSPRVRSVTRMTVLSSMPKFALINDLLARHRLDDYEYLILCDDDVELPERFLDRFLTLQEQLDFRLAQPARSSASHIDHPIVEQQLGVLARQTWFVESGPMVCAHRSVFDLLLPFPLESPMGWGYEGVWSLELARRGLKMGIVDAFPIEHRMRRPVTYYRWQEADEGRQRLLQARSHRPLDQCFRVLAIVTGDAPR